MWNSLITINDYLYPVEYVISNDLLRLNQNVMFYVNLTRKVGGKSSITIYPFSVFVHLFFSIQH